MQTFYSGRRPTQMKREMHECSGTLQQRGGIPLVLNCASPALGKKTSETEALKTKFSQLILDSKVSEWSFLRVQIMEGFVALKMQNSSEHAPFRTSLSACFRQRTHPPPHHHHPCSLKTINSIYHLLTFYAGKDL